MRENGTSMRSRLFTCAANGSGSGVFLLFRPLVLGGQTHGGFLGLRGDELVHTVLVEETLEESELVSLDNDTGQLSSARTGSQTAEMMHKGKIVLRW